ncbi:hypothetical protein [Actinoplanes sp. NPDC051851]|uniref:hypothetical protein n=1 Tax=Actinoplanes sp. NPDC051851 TaxID=3154753 RepID=UPI00341F1D76
MPARRTALRLTLIAPLLLGSAASAAGCEIAVAPGSVPVPFSVAPVPSASASRPEYVCTAIYKILTDGAVRLAEYATGSTDAAEEGLRTTFATMATDVTAAGAKSADATQRAAVDEIAATLTTGSTAEDPKAFLDGDFSTIGQKLDGTCT